MRAWPPALTLSVVALLAPGFAHAAAPPLPPAARTAFAMADSLLRSRQSAPALALLDSLERSATSRADAPIRARALYSRGAALALMGQSRAAEPVLREAVPLALSVGDSVACAESARWLAWTWVAGNRLREADSLYRWALPLAQRSHARRAEAYIRLGRAYIQMQTGRAREAIPQYRIVAGQFRDLGDAYGELQAGVGRGRCFSTLGRLDSAATCFRETALRASALGQMQSAGDALNNLAAIEHRRGRIDRAIEGYYAAIECFRRAGVPEAGGTATTNLALALGSLGRSAEAAACLDSVVVQASASGRRFQLSNALRAKGELYELLDELATGAAVFRQALAPPLRLTLQDQVACRTGLAQCLNAIDSTGAALAVLEGVRDEDLRAVDAERRAQFLYVKASVEGVAGRLPEALASANGVREESIRSGLRAGQVTAISLRGRIEARAGNFTAARADLREALTLWRSERAADNSLSWLESHQSITRGLFTHVHDAILADPALGPLEKRVSMAYGVLGDLKGRSLLDLAPEPSPRDTSRIPALSLELLRQRALGPGELVVDFYLSRDRSFALLVSRQHCALVNLPPMYQIVARLATYRDLLSTRPAPGTPDDDAVRAAGRALGELIFGAEATRVRSAARLVLSPDGPLAEIPFEALTIPGESEPLGLLHEIEYTPAVALWARSRAQAPSGAPGAPAPHVLALAGSRNAAGQPLDGAVREVRALGTRYANVSVRIDPPVRSVSARGALAPGSDALHVASHGEALRQYPWRSGLLLDPSRAGSDEGWLRAEAIARLRVPQRLVVLASCASARGRWLSGAGVEGLTGAFVLSGARTVVSSLWQVDDASTAALMDRFYGALARGATAGTALREARRELAHAPATSQPYYWAAFVLTGDGRTLLPLRGPTARRGT